MACVAAQYVGSVSLAIGNNPGGGVLTGTTNVTVVNGTASFTGLAITVGGGTGYALTATTASPITGTGSDPFDINNPAPAITSLNPFWTRTASGLSSITITGTGFVPDSVVEWNGNPRTTHFVSSTEVAMDVQAADIASANTAQIIVSNPPAGGGDSADLSFRVEDGTPAVVYVDDGYVGLGADTLVDWPYTGAGSHIIGYDAFATIQGGVNAVATNGTVNVAAGTYPEVVVVNRPLILLGAQAGLNSSPRLAAFTAGANGPKADPSVESVITAATTDPTGAANDSVHIMADHVTIDGFVVDGNNPALAQAGAVVIGGINTDSRRAIETEDAAGSFISANSVMIKNNIIQNYAQRGIELVNPTDTSPETSGSLITGNVIGNFGLDGILLANNAYSDITSNIVTMASGSEAGIWMQDSGNPGTGVTPANIDWSHNTVTVCQDAFGGIWVNLFHSSASTISIHDNTVNAATGVTGNDDYTYGIYLTSVEGGTTPKLTNNIVGFSGGQFARGIALWNLPTTSPTTVSGGTVSNSLIAVSLSYDDENFNGAGSSFTANLSGINISGANVGVLVEATNASPDSVQMQISGDTVVTACVTGISILGTNASASVINNSASITGNGIGIDVDTGKALIQNNDLTGNTVAGIWATNGAVVDAGDCNDGNVTGLGSSTGGNDLSGYLGGPALAIINGNPGGLPAVLADHDNFGASSAADIIPAAFSGPVVYSQTSAVIAPPTNVTVTCVGDVPAGATSLSGFTNQGGYFSASAASVSFSDSTNLNGGNAGSGTITRTYTLADSCATTTNCTQIITVSDTNPPVIMISPNIVQGVDPGENYATVLFTNTVVDNCDPNPVVVVTPASGSQFAVGTNVVTVTATDVSGNSAANSFTVAVIALPGITSQPQSRTNNAGTAATFTVVAESPAPLSYQWFKGASPLSDGGNLSGATTDTLTIADVQDADVADYTVQISNLAGSVSSTPAAHLTVIDPPVITSITPPNQTNNATTTAVFAVTNTGTAPFSYQWTKITATETNVLSDGGNISGSTNNVLVITNVLAADQATYAVSIHNPAGTVTTNAFLAVNDPAIFGQPTNVTQVLGGNVSFSVTAAGTAPLYYQWLEKNVVLPGQTASNLVINGISDSDAGNFSVLVSNSVGSVTSSNAVLTITHPPVFVTQPASLVVNQGGSATFTVSLSGHAPFSYQCLKDGSPVTGWIPVTGYQLTLNNVTASNDGFYSVVVTNADGSATSSNALLTVIVPPLITSQPSSLTNNAGMTAVLSVTNSGSPATYQWFKNGTNLLSDGGKISGSSTAVLTITNVLGADSATYDVVISNSADVVTSDNATLVVIDPIITSQPVSRTNNLGTPASFTVAAYGTAPQYQWLKNGSVIPGATVATYSIAGVSDADVAGYSVVVSNTFGSVTSAPPATLTVIDPPVITSAPASLTVNATSNATFTVGYTGTAPGFQWLKNGNPLSDTGNVSGATTPSLTLTDVQDGDQAGYSVVLSNALNVVTSAPPATLTVIDPPVITNEPVNLTVNAGQTAIFSAGYTGTAPGFQWFKNDTNALVDGGNVHGANTANLTLSNVFGIDGADYKVVLVNAAGSATSAPPAHLTVIDPVITGQPAGVTNIDGVTVEFTVSAVGTSPLNYQWFVDGYILNDETNRTLTLVDVADSDAGNYTVVITNVYGSVTSTPAVLVTVPPLIVTQPASVVALVGQSVSFSVNVNGATPFTYQWQKNNADMPGENARILSFTSVQTTDAGTYRVLVTNPLGTQWSDPATLTVYTNPVSLLTISFASNVASIGLTGLPGYNYAIQGSSNLLDWVPLQTNIAPFTLKETNSDLFINRFYRGVYLP